MASASNRSRTESSSLVAAGLELVAAHTAASIRVEGLSKIYGSVGPRRAALTEVSFELKRGEIVGLLGPNGAGKTTTIKCICGLVRPSSGSVHVEGIDAVRRRGAALTQMSVVLEGNRNLTARLSVGENLLLAAALHGLPPSAVAPRARLLLERFGLQGRMRVPVQHLSRGMQQALALASALMKRTPILILDEPTIGLDLVATTKLAADLVAFARDERQSVLLSTHDLRLAERICDRVVIIDAGRVVADRAIAELPSSPPPCGGRDDRKLEDFYAGVIECVR